MSFLPAIISLERLLFVSLREVYCARSCSSTRWHSWDGRRKSGACVPSKEPWCRIPVPYLHLLFRRSTDINRFYFMRFVNTKTDPRCLAPTDFTYCSLLQSNTWPVPVMNDHSSIHITALAFTTVIHTRRDSWKSRVSRDVAKKWKNNHSHSLIGYWHAVSLSFSHSTRCGQNRVYRNFRKKIIHSNCFVAAAVSGRFKCNLSACVIAHV